MDLHKSVAVVTGAGRGIGCATAFALAEQGCRVVLVARTREQIEEAVHTLAGNGHEALGLTTDLGAPGAPESVIRSAVERFGRLDVLINNAAVLFRSEYLDVTEAEWDQVMAVNLKAPFFLCQAALRVMGSQGGGYIINISSTAALMVPPAITTYGISKVGLVGLSQALYETAKSVGVKVSVVYPGMTDTEMLRGFNPPVAPEKWMSTLDIVDCILFLLTQSDRVVIRDLVPWASRHDKI
jgi:gluconate 5-dehydrogenase